jgi:hypothetical protein
MHPGLWRALAHVITPRSLSTLERRFYAKTIRAGACLLWNGSLKKNGYGSFRMGAGLRTTRHAHRLAYELMHGPLKKGVQVLHDCDTPRCVAWRHLWASTQKENLADSISKGRFHVGRGLRSENHPRALPTNAQVRAIRRLFRSNHANSSNANQLAKRFGVGVWIIRNVVYRKTYSSIQ